ncbi:Fanconi-associated nuclease 1, partial [Ophiophagus hannah]
MDPPGLVLLQETPDGALFSQGMQKLQFRVPQLHEDRVDPVKGRISFGEWPVTSLPSSVQDGLAADFVALTKALYDFHHALGGEAVAGSPLEQLVVENFDEEQIWQQLELQNHAVLGSLKKAVARNVEDEGKGVLSLLPDIEEEEEEEDEAGDGEEDMDVEDQAEKEPSSSHSEEEEEEEEGLDQKRSNSEASKNGPFSDEDSELDFDIDKLEQQTQKSKSVRKKGGTDSLVDDRFFKLSEMEAALEAEEKEGERENDSDGIDYFEEILSEDEEEEFGALKKKAIKSARELKYQDYFDPVDESSDPPDEKEDDQNSQSGEGEEEEEEEGGSAESASDDLEEETVSFQGKSSKPPEMKSSFEKRQEKAWDDVVRKEKPKEDPFEYKKRLTLDQEKSKLSLAEIYEQEYLKLNQKKTEEEEKPEHIEIQKMMDSLFVKLDALSNFHFMPKPPVPEVKIVSNLPAITMEEVAPVHVSNAALLAPEEIKEKNKGGDVKTDAEKTPTDKKRDRRKKKLMKRVKLKEKERRQKLLEKTLEPGAKLSKKASGAQLKKLTKERGTSLLKGPAMAEEDGPPDKKRPRRNSSLCKSKKKTAKKNGKEELSSAPNSSSIVSLFSNAPPARIACPLCGQTIPRNRINQHMDEECKKNQNEDNVNVIGLASAVTPGSSAETGPVGSSLYFAAKFSTPEKNCSLSGGDNLETKRESGEKVSPYFKKAGKLALLDDQPRVGAIKNISLGTLSTRLSRRWRGLSRDGLTQDGQPSPTQVGTTEQKPNQKPWGEDSLRENQLSPSKFGWTTGALNKECDTSSLGQEDGPGSLSDSLNDSALVSLSCRELGLSRKGHQQVSNPQKNPDVYQLGISSVVEEEGLTATYPKEEPPKLESQSFFSNKPDPMTEEDYHHEMQKLSSSTGESSMDDEAGAGTEVEDELCLAILEKASFPKSSGNIGPGLGSPGHPYYLRNFLMVVEAVLENEDDRRLTPTQCHFFRPLCKNILSSLSPYNSIVASGQKLYVRLFQRKLAWIKMNKIEYAEISSDLSPVIKELVEAGFLQSEIWGAVSHDLAKKIDFRVFSRSHHRALPEYLRRFTVGWLYTRILSQGVEILQRLHLYQEAVEQLQELLAQEDYCVDSRGQWWERLALNLHQHLKDTKKAVESIQKGLLDPFLRPGHQLGLSQRVQRMKDTPAYQKFKHLLLELPLLSVDDVTHVSTQLLQGTAQIVMLVGETSGELGEGEDIPGLALSLNQDPSLTQVTIKGKLCPQTRMGKSMFILESQSERAEPLTVVCSVEELALAHYKQQGFDQGKLLPALHFYKNRQSAIEARLQSVRDASTETLQKWVGKVWGAQEGKASVLISWNRFSSLQQAQSLVCCLGGPFLSGVCRRLSQDLRHCRGGLPDLVVWRTEDGQFKLVEVKGPGDRLSHKQMVWLDELQKLGASVEVCHVEAVGSKSQHLG